MEVATLKETKEMTLAAVKLILKDGRELKTKSTLSSPSQLWTTDDHVWSRDRTFSFADPHNDLHFSNIPR